MIRVSIALFCLALSAMAANLPSGFEPNLFFEPNKGQAHPRVEYFSRGAGVTAHLLDREAVLRAGKYPIRMQLVRAQPCIRCRAGASAGRLQLLRGQEPLAVEDRDSAIRTRTLPRSLSR